MIATGRRSVSEATRREMTYPSGLQAVRSEWMMTGEDPGFSPTIFLFEQPPGVVLPAHYHRNNEFQVFVDGSGKIGPRAIVPTMVHYAGAYTGYGPIVAGPQGLKYFTIRAAWEIGALMVADTRGQVPPGPRRHATSKPIGEAGMDQLRALADASITPIFPRAADGLAATLVELPPEGTFAPEAPGGGGTFLVVLTGSLACSDETFERWESVYVGVDGSFPAVRAGPDGVQFLELCLPPTDPAYLDC